MNYTRTQLETLRDLVISARVQAALDQDLERIVTGEFWNIEISKMIADMKIEEVAIEELNKERINAYDEFEEESQYLVRTISIETLNK